MLTTAIASQKGGTGKTSTTVNLGAALSRAGHSVLLVDMDPQASLTEYFVSTDELKATIYDALKNGITVSPLHIGATISLLPANIDLAAAEEAEDLVIGLIARDLRILQMRGRAAHRGRGVHGRDLDAHLIERGEIGDVRA